MRGSASHSPLIPFPFKEQKNHIMYMRKVTFVNDEYYHIYNRGVDKRTIFESQEDLDRFYLSMKDFNVIEPIGSIYLNNQRMRMRGSASHSPRKEKLVEFISYCLNPNHYHFLLKQLVDNGIQKFMHKVGTGYTMYFNEKYKRNGSLFQGRYKAIHIGSDKYLLHLSAYINLNYEVHFPEKMRGSASHYVKSSWDEYVNDNDSKDKKGFCEKDIILDQFGSARDYKEFAEDSLKRIRENKAIKKFLLELKE